MKWDEDMVQDNAQNNGRAEMKYVCESTLEVICFTDAGDADGGGVACVPGKGACEKSPAPPPQRSDGVKPAR